MSDIARGLEGINVTATKLCRIDGQKGELVYAGYDIYEVGWIEREGLIAGVGLWF